MEFQTNKQNQDHPNDNNLDLEQKNQYEGRQKERQSQDASTAEDELEFDKIYKQIKKESYEWDSNQNGFQQNNYCCFDFEENDDTNILKMEEENDSQNSQLSFDNKNIQNLKTQLFIEQLKDQIKNIAKLHKISLGRAFDLLRSMDYNEYHCDYIPFTLKKQILIQNNSNNKKTQYKPQCFVCYTDLTEETRYSLDCFHYFCRDTCFNEYMKSILTLGSAALFKTCPLEGCKERIGLKEFCQFYLPSQQRRVERLMLQDYLTKRRDLIECPYPDCKQLLIHTQQDFQNQINIRCSCRGGSLFCSSCKSEPHQPLNCESLKKWQSVVNEKDQSVESLKYIENNTRNCPQCKSPVEKDGGCMHMFCSQCSSHFCWNCMIVTTGVNHPFNCNSKSAKLLAQSNAQKEQFKQYFKRLFIQYKRAADQTQASQTRYISQMEEKLLPMFRNEERLKKQTQFFNEALLTLVEAKYAFAYSFGSGYLMDKIYYEFLEYLQDEMSQIINQFEFHLTNYVKSLKNIGQHQNDLITLSLFQEFKDLMIGEILHIQTKLRYFVNEISSSMPHNERFQNQQSQMLVEQFLIEEDNLQKLLKAEKRFQQEEYEQQEQKHILEALKISYKMVKSIPQKDSASMCQICNLNLATFEISCDECFAQQLQQFINE